MSLARYRVLRCTVSRCCSWSSHSTSQPPSRASSNLQPGAHLYWAGRRHETVARSRCALPSSASLSLRPQAQLFAASKEDEHLVCKRNAACSAVSLAPACSQVAGFVDVSAGVFQRTGPETGNLGWVTAHASTVCLIYSAFLHCLPAGHDAPPTQSRSCL